MFGVDSRKQFFVIFTDETSWGSRKVVKNIIMSKAGAWRKIEVRKWQYRYSCMPVTTDDILLMYTNPGTFGFEAFVIIHDN